MRKRAYRWIGVKDVQESEVLGRLAKGPVWVGVDVAKEEVLVVVRDSSGQFERPWKVKQPSELGVLVERLLSLEKDHTLAVALESTGTYGDALRQALTDAGLEVRRVSSKAASDYAEIFDGVPSNHDGKDAAMLAELGAHGKSQSWPWKPSSAWDEELEQHVEWLATQQEILQLWLGRLEALLARHWPEATTILKLNSVTVLRCLAHYGGPAGLVGDPDAARQLRRWGGSNLSLQKIETLLQSARNTAGVRMTPGAEARIKRYAQAALGARAELTASERELAKLVPQDATLRRMAEFLGSATACVLWVAVGDPRDYSSAAAYRKAIGLNLKERSSGKYKGKLKITKRGPSLARRWLFFGAMRLVQRPPVRAWFEAKKRKDQDRGLGAVVAVMRKLALAIHVVATHEEPFQIERLLPGRPLPAVARGSAAPLGALPPDPRDLAHGVKSKAGGGEKREAARERPRLAFEPESALGSVPTGALSSAQAHNP